MKIALALLGYFDTQSTGQSKGMESYRKIQSYFSGANFDTYIHTWQPERAQLLTDLYKPKKIVAEKQIDFTPIAKANNIHQEWFDEGIDRVALGHQNATVHRTLSFFYTRSQSIKLIDNIESYDYVFSMRLDVGNVGPTEVNFPHKFKLGSDSSKIYTPYWEHINVGLGDMWTILNGSNAKHLEDMYDVTLEALKPTSTYIRMMTEGWPYSEYYTFGDNSDIRQFSNISISKKRVEQEMRYPKWYCINNHSLYKYFFLKKNLFSHLKFI